MFSTITIPPTLRPRPSSSMSTLAAGARISPLIEDVSVISVEHQQQQQQAETVFTLKVIPHKVKNGLRPYIIKRTYHEFVNFCQLLTAEQKRTIRPPFYRCDRRAMVPKLAKNGGFLQSSKKQDTLQRRTAAIDSFCKTLFDLSPTLSRAECVVDFFGSRKTDLEVQLRQTQKQFRGQRRRQDHVTLADTLPPQLLTRSRSSPVQLTRPTNQCCLRRSASQPELLRIKRQRVTYSNNNNNKNNHCGDINNQAGESNHNNNNNQHLSFSLFSPKDAAPVLSPLPPTSKYSSLHSLDSQPIMPTTSASTQRIVSKPSFQSRWTLRSKPQLATFCSQAAHIIKTPSSWMSKRVQAPTITPSTPLSSTLSLPPSISLPVAKPDNTIISSRVDKSSSIVSTASRRSSQQIKVKVVYDIDNIIVIKVPRTITLADIRAQILAKFSGTPVRLKSSFTLLYCDSRGSASSVIPEPSKTGVRIHRQKEWFTAMQSEWQCLEKITLRCCMK